jgi:membrane protease YdiL (CAAX protease family)
VLIATGLIKAMLTPALINLGWRGGHFFPVIFSGVSLGYGLAVLTGADPVFCVAVCTASTMGAVMRQPVMVVGLLLMCFPLMYVGSLIGNVLASLLSGGKASNSVSDLAMQFDVWNVVFLVILGPLFEEWIFRKELISRTRKYGERTAIVFSALFFGLVHMNLFQFFYAFALGLMFGYVYVRTSKLRYSVVMHMFVNFMGGVVAPWVVTNVDIDSLMNVLTSAENGDGTAMMQWMGQNATGMMIFGIYMLLYYGLIIAGVVLLIRERKNFEFYSAPEELSRGVRTSTAILNVGVITYIVVTVIITAINLMM